MVVKLTLSLLADIIAVVQPCDGESFLNDFFKKDLDRWGEQVSLLCFFDWIEC